MRDPNPTVILIPGLGMIAWGKDKSESRVTAEFYNCAVEVMRGAEAIDEYIALPQQEAFDIEYWLLEEAKLKRMPPEKELARQVIAVDRRRQRHRPRGRAAAGQGGRARRLRRPERRGRARRRRKAIADKHGTGHRRGRQRHFAAAGRPSAWPATSPSARASGACSTRRSLAYGGFDGVAVTAGIFVAAGHARATSPTTSGR